MCKKNVLQTTCQSKYHFGHICVVKSNASNIWEWRIRLRITIYAHLNIQMQLNKQLRARKGYTLNEWAGYLCIIFMHLTNAASDGSGLIFKFNSGFQTITSLYRIHHLPKSCHMIIQVPQCNCCCDAKVTRRVSSGLNTCTCNPLGFRHVGAT